jgi:thymidylate synthase (FAD)
MMSKQIELYGDGVGYVGLVDHLGDDLSVVNSARVSFGKHKTEVEEKDKKLISYLIKHRHTSTLEHNVVTFRFKVPLFVRSQHHRHRTWSYNEISRRYTDFNIEFYEPQTFRTQHKSNRQASNSELVDPLLAPYPGFANGAKCGEVVIHHHRACLQLYENMIEAGVCREQARGVLPQNVYTEYYGTANLNNILKFIDLRTHEGAQWEIQQVAKAMTEIIRDLYPVTLGAWEENRSA